MVSPAKAHFLRVSAAALAVGTSAAVNPNANQYELMLAKLAEDRRRLKDVQSIERKAEVKRQLLPEYMPWIEGVLQGDSGQQDDVFMTVLVWLIDIAAIEQAIPLALYAIGHKLSLPDQYKRTTGCLIAEEVADIALKGTPISHVLLMAVSAMTEGEDMPDEVRAKLQKAIGYALRDFGDLPAARERLAYALKLHEKVGVKKDIERLDVLIKNSANGESQG